MPIKLSVRLYSIRPYTLCVFCIYKYFFFCARERERERENDSSLFWQTQVFVLVSRVVEWDENSNKVCRQGRTQI